MTAFSYKNKRILIVDDQRAFHIMLKTMLINQGASDISCTDSAENAIRLAQHKPFDIYLVDYNLGSGKNGSQLIHYFRKNKLIPSSAICFIVTGDSNQEMVLTAVEAAPDDYLIKPFSQKQLFHRLSNAYQKKFLLADIFDAIENEDLDMAISLCKTKIEEAPKFKTLCKNILAEILIQQKDYKSAEEILQSLIAHRLLIRSSINLGKVYYLEKKYAEAINLLTQVISRSPLQMEAHRWLARSYQKSGDSKEALNILSRAANMTHHSIERYQEVALLANEMNEHEIIISSYSSILQLSRRSFYPDPCHLANYIRSIIDYAKEEDDINERKIILKKVNSTLYQSRFEEGQNKDFDFNSFDEICQAKVLFTLNQSGRAKRKILATLHNKEAPIADFDNTLLCESTFSLLDIGEFEYAAPYLDELKQRDISDPTTQAAIEKQTGITLETRIQTFKSHNRAGIDAFANNNLEDALKHFNQALKVEPLNSGVLLNRLQVYIELLKLSGKGTKQELFDKCRRTLDRLNNTNLPEEHSVRYKALKSELFQIK